MLLVQLPRKCALHLSTPGAALAAQDYTGLRGLADFLRGVAAPRTWFLRDFSLLANGVSFAEAQVCLE